MSNKVARRGQISIDTVDIRLLRIFMCVVEAGGLSAAQAELSLSLSTISEKIGALEQRLGLKLCKRGRSGFLLTENGHVIFGEAQRLLVSLDKFSKRASGLRTQIAGTLSVGLIDNIITDSRSPIAATFAELAEIAPSLNLTVETLPPGELLRDVVSQRLDLAIGSFPRISLGLKYIDLYDEQQNFYCGRDHPLFKTDDEKIGIETVRAHRIIGRSYWGAHDVKIFAISSPHATVSNMEAEAHLILSGAYLGHLPDHYAEQFVREGKMRAISRELFSYKAKFQIALSHDWKRRAVLRTFVEAIRRSAPAASEAGIIVSGTKREAMASET